MPEPSLKERLESSVRGAVASTVESVGAGLELLGMTEAGRKLTEYGVSLRDKHAEQRYARDVLNWFISTTAQGLASTGASLAGGLGTAALGQAVGIPAPIGFIAGAASMAYLQNAGETYLRLREQGVEEPRAREMAGFTGGLKTLLDVVVPFRVGGKVMWKAAETGGKALAKEVGKSALQEGATESAQELLDSLAEMHAGRFRGAADTLANMVNSFMAGALVGGIYGVAGTRKSAQVKPQTVQSPEAPAPKPAPPKVEQITEPALARPAEASKLPILPDLPKPSDRILPPQPPDWLEPLANHASTVRANAPAIEVHGAKSHLLDLDNGLNNSAERLALSLSITKKIAEEAWNTVAEVDKNKLISGIDIAASSSSALMIPETSNKTWRLAISAFHSVFPDPTLWANGVRFAVHDALSALGYPIEVTDQRLTRLEQNVADYLVKHMDELKMMSVLTGQLTQNLAHNPALFAPLYSVYPELAPNQAVGPVHVLFNYESPTTLMEHPFVYEGLTTDPLGTQARKVHDALLEFRDIWEPLAKPTSTALVDILDYVTRSPATTALRFKHPELSNLHIVAGTGFVVSPRAVGLFTSRPTLPGPLILVDPIWQPGRPSSHGEQVVLTILHEIAHASAKHVGEALSETDFRFVNVYNDILKSSLPRLRAHAKEIQNAYNKVIRDAGGRRYNSLTHAIYVRVALARIPTRVRKGDSFAQTRHPSVGPISPPDISPVYTTAIRGAVETTGLGASARGRPSSSRTEPRRAPVSSEDYDNGTWPGTPTATPAAAGPTGGAGSAGGGTGGLTPQPSSISAVPAPLRNDVVRFGRMSRQFLTLHQISLRNPRLLPLRLYMNGMAEFARSKYSVLADADLVLKDWRKLSRTENKALADLLYAATLYSHRRRRRLTNSEIAQIGKRVGANNKVLDMFDKIDTTLISVINRLETALIDEAVEVYGPVAPIKVTKITEQFDKLRARHYFPLKRFGDYVVVVRKGNSVEHLESFESQRAAERGFAALQKKYGPKGFQVKLSMSRDYVKQYIDFPPALLEAILRSVSMPYAQAQELLDLFYSLAPGRAFIKHMTERRGTPGFSRDAERSFAAYMQSAASHIARIENRRTLESAIEALRRRAALQSQRSVELDRLVNYLMEHKESIFSPESELSALRGAMFLWFFAYVPKQLVVNLTQIPMFTYPWLQERYGQAATLKALPKAIQDLGPRWMRGGTLTQEELDAFQLGLREGFLDEGFATNVAGVAERPLVRRFLGLAGLEEVWDRIIQFGIAGFQIVEQFNRRVTFLAAYRLARQSGATTRQSYRAAREAVQVTQGEYANWNRYRLARQKGIKAVPFIMKTYLQNAMYFFMTDKSHNFSLRSQGGLTTWAIMAALGGLLGFPFAEDLLDIIQGVLARLGKYFDPKTELRKLLAEFGADPDLFINGAARYGFGLSGLNWLLGVPVPHIDLSPSVQFGHLLPGVREMKRAAVGTAGWKDVALAFATETIGVTGNVGAGFFRGIFEHNADSLAWLRNISPAAIRNAVRFHSAITNRRLISATGDTLIDFDLSNPEHVGEIVGMLMGMTPTRLSLKVEGRMASDELIKYYQVRRTNLFMQYTLALQARDKEALSEVKTAIKEFNAMVPKAARITGSDLREAVKSRLKNQKLDTLGLPEQKRYRTLGKEVIELYNLP